MQFNRLVSWCRTLQGNRVISGDSAWWLISAGLLHQVISGGPVAMTIEQRTDNSTAQHAGKCFLISFRIERGGYFLAVREAANVQTLFIRGTATEARHVWRICFLETLFTHGDRVSRKAAGLAKLKEVSGKERKRNYIDAMCASAVAKSSRVKAPCGLNIAPLGRIRPSCTATAT